MTKTWLSLSIVVGLVFMLAAPTLADYQAGLDALKSGDYEAAMNEFRPLAEQGDEKAVKGLELLEKEMTPAQLAEAQRLAREWKAKGK